jgi:formylglycine-generating enzyme required for sulfatase activity
MSVPGAKRATDATYTNTVGMEFLLIPAGSFQMGSADEDRDAAANEKPRHRVAIGRPFYLGKYEVTQAQWQAVMGSSPHTLPRSNSFYDIPGMAARLNNPTNPATVSWNDAQEFVRRLNRKEGQSRYRLPTEAEWEYAARAGTTNAYSFGDDGRQLHRYAWHGEDFVSGAHHRVGEKAPNPWGLHDIHGNVWEWVQDFYTDRYGPTDAEPSGPPAGSGHVVRGGSWHVTSNSWRSAVRKEYDADYRGISIGFRVALDVTQ